MAGGWGTAHFAFRNDGQTPGKITHWNAHWEANGKQVGDPWDSDLTVDVPVGQTVTHDETESLPEDVVAQAKPGAAAIVGTFTVTGSGSDPSVTLPFRLEVPAATLPEPLKIISGKHVGFAVMPSHLKTFHSQKRILSWLNEAYARMQELTGETPYDGKVIILQESPANPYYAYAGNPVILNSDYVGQALQEIDKGWMPFGWIHEIGHDFDVRGDWYIWNGPSAEWQANWKLAYAISTLPDQSFLMNMGGSSGSAYPIPSGAAALTSGPQFVDSFFTFFGDNYLADPTRTWDTMTSDEIHSFYQRIQRAYGWEPFRQWYRAYHQFDTLGLKKPETPEGKVQLTCAILSQETGVDLVPVYRRWRMPVTEDDVTKMRAAYPISTLPK